MGRSLGPNGTFQVSPPSGSMSIYWTFDPNDRTRMLKPFHLVRIAASPGVTDP